MTKSERIGSIDVLRGIAIFGMVFCASIGWHSNLPAWMYHAQVPPPDYIFNPDIRGITWVDLVFPFFLFSMGAAFPFSMNKRLAEGMSRTGIILSLFKRWLILISFSIVLGNAHRLSSAGTDPAIINILKIAVWGALFLSLGRFRFKKRIINVSMNISGLLLIAAIGAIMHFTLGIRLSKWHSDIIIMVLAYVSFLGGTIWLFTKGAHKARWMIFGLILLIKASASYFPEIFSFLPDMSGAGWIFRFSFLQYLLIAIPGSITGDLILQRKDNMLQHGNKKHDTMIAGAGLFVVIFQLWGFFTRAIAVDLAVTSVIGAVVITLSCRNKTLWTDILRLGFILLIAGIVFDPIDGGIRKDHCNISYLLATSGIAAIVTGILTFAESSLNIRFKALSVCGQNPMVAYTVTNFITLPLLSLIGLLPVIDGWTYGSQAVGLFRGILITAIMMAITIFFTNRRIFWRS